MAQGYAQLTTPPAVEPLSLADAKAHLRVDTDDDNDYITTLITVARQAIEHRTRRAIISQTWTQYLNGFPSVMELIKPPVASVTSIKYLDVDGSEQTWSSTAYQTDIVREPAIIIPVDGQSYPSVQSGTLNTVYTEFVSGYSTSSTGVPSALVHAVKILVAHWYEQREEVITGATVTEVPDSVDALVAQYAMPEFT